MAITDVAPAPREPRPGPRHAKRSGRARFAQFLGGLGRFLIGSGLIILLFVVYQLWGTGIHHSRAQDRLESEFDELLAEAAPEDDVAEIEGPTGTPTRAGQPLPPPDDGQAIARLAIPEIGIDEIIVEGVRLSDLRDGPGHYPDSPMPGQEGNAAIAGHRTTYGAPFFRLDELERGDEILVTTLQGEFVYEMTEARVVGPGAIEVLDDFEDNRLTLTTCNPRYSARERLVVVAALVDDPAPSRAPDVVTENEISSGGDLGIPDEPVTLDGGLSGEGASRAPAVAWGIAASFVLATVVASSHYWRKWMAWMVGTPLFLVVLYVFFENFSRLLPANF